MSVRELIRACWRGMDRTRLVELVRQLDHDRSGSMALLFAGTAALSVILCAFSVDEGALYLQRRHAQASVDLAAIAAASDPANAFAIVRGQLVRAGLIPASLSDTELTGHSGATHLAVETGTYRADPTLSVSARYVSGTAHPDAVHVHFTMPGTLYFAKAWSAPPTIGVSALASADPKVTFSVGSSLVRLDGGIANAVLNGLLGSNLSLSAVSYQGLLDARISAFGFLDALAQELGVTAGTYDDVLALSAGHGTIAKAIADNLTGAQKTAALTLAAALGDSAKVPIDKLFALGDAGHLAIGSGARSGMTADLSALQLLAVCGALSDGTHQVALNLAAGLPGLASLSASLAVGEPAQFAPWYAIGPDGTVVRTSQVRLRLVASIGGGALLPGVSIRIPLYLAVANAAARVQSASCPAPGTPYGAATIATLPGVARLSLGEVEDPAFASFTGAPNIGSARLITTPLLKVTGAGSVDIGQIQPVPLAFSSADIADGEVRVATTSAFTQSLTASLFDHLDLNVSLLGLNLGLNSAPAVKAAIETAIAPLPPVLDATISSLLTTLGLALGSADVRVYGVQCTHSVLVG